MTFVPRHINQPSPTIVAGGSAPNIFDFGAKGDGINDDAPAFRAMIAAGATATNNHYAYNGSFDIPPGKYALGKPLIFNGSYRFRGAGKYRTVFQNHSDTFFGGPLFLISPDANNSNYRITTAPALLTGAGSSMRLDNNAPQWLNLRDTHVVEVNGATAFTAEFTFKIDPGDTSGNGVINLLNLAATDFTSAPINNGATGAFSIELDRLNSTDYIFRGHLRTANNGLVNVWTGATLAAGVNNHVALTYDGAHAKLWVNGALDKSAACTGGIVQGPFESIDLNGGVLGWPASPHNSPSAQGWIDGIRFSSSVRYTTGFTPPVAKFTPDSSTLLVLNFDAYDGAFVLGQTYWAGHASPCYILTRPTQPGDFIPENEFSDFGLTQSGVGTPRGFDGFVINGCVNSSFRNLDIYGLINGMEIIGQNFSAVIYDNLTFNVNGSFAYNATGAAGFSTLTNCVFITGLGCGVASAGASLNMNNVNITPNQFSQYGLIALGRSFFQVLNMVNVGIDDETNGPFVACAVIQGVPSVAADTCTFDCSASTVGSPISLIIEGKSGWPTNVAMRACEFSGPSGWTLIQQNASQPLAKITLDAPANFTGVSSTLSNNPGNIVLLNALGMKANNQAGTGSATGTVAAVGVAFATAFPDTAYAVTLVPSTSTAGTISPMLGVTTGNPASGSNRPLSVTKSASGFVVALEAAPGAGKTQNFDWVATRL